MENEKTEMQVLEEKLVFKNENGGTKISEDELKKAFDFCEDYKKFLDASKTEGECVLTVVKRAEEKGYKPFEAGKKYAPGDKVYLNNRNAALILATIGKRPLADGVRIIASHIDSPRLDLKPNPLYEDSNIAYFKTHYYGGVKKYQWLTIPLSLHGVVYKADGEMVRINIGDDDNDPLFYITDLLPHLGREQNKKPLGEAVPGESLNLIVGSLPVRDEKVKEKVKLAVLKILNEKYGITEADFHTADLKAVPMHKARDIGLDRSLIASYGHDDRVCAYASLIADFSAVSPEYTTITILSDKEEVGSSGNTGLKSMYFVYFIEDLCDSEGVKARHVLSKSKCLSADVNGAFDPGFAEVYEKRNSSFINHGVGVSKYVGAGGKSGTTDASAEFMSFIRLMLDNGNVLWQTGELGKIDAGGGGTVGQFIANYNIDIVDIGVPVISMHSPYEVVSKIDVYMTFRAFEEFYK